MIALTQFHFFVINLVTLFSFPLTYVFLSHYEIIMHATLLVLLLNNLVFVLASIWIVRIRASYILFSFLLLINLGIGIKSFGVSSKTFIDFSYCFLFFAKIFVLKELLVNDELRNTIKRNLLIYALVALVSSILGTAFFYLLPQNASAYAGLTPSIMPFFILSVLSLNPIGIVIGALIVLLSGKRAMMLSAALVMLFGLLKGGGRNKAALALLVIIAGSIAVIGPSLIGQNASIDKITRTVEVFSEGDEDQINSSTGMRLFEIYSIVEDMSAHDYLMGKGAGYTYDVVVGGLVLDEGHANAHFTPIGFVSKYGIFISLFLILLIFKAFISPSNGSLYNKFLKLYLFSFCIESLFSYLIFNDKILAFVIALLLSTQSNISSRKAKE